MFWTLVRKDLRLLRPAWIAAGLIVLLAYGVLWPTRLTGTLTDDVGNRWRWLALMRLDRSIMVGLVASTLVAALLGGIVQPRERRERWADFVDMLPISRRKRIAATLLCGLAAWSAVWIVHATATAMFLTGERNWLRDYTINGAWFEDPWSFATVRFALRVPLMALGLFGVAWTAGAVLRSSAVAVSIAIAAGVVGVFIAWQAAVSVAFPPEHYIPTLLDVAGIIGAAGVVVGTVVLLRRVSP